MTYNEYEKIQPLNGLYTGQLSTEELVLLHRAIEEGWARKTYNGPLAVFGLSKVEIMTPLKLEDDESVSP